MPLHRAWLSIRLFVRSLFRPAVVERDVDDELGDHVEREIGQLVARGVPRDEARRRALGSLGSVAAQKDDIRDTRGLNAIDHTLQDLRYAVRVLRQAPIFSVVAILSLTLGIGANTAIFQLLNALRLQTLRVPAPEELTIVRINDRGWPNGSFNGRYADFTYRQWELLSARQQAFSGLAAWGTANFDLSAAGESRFAENAIVVSGSFFPVLRLTPAAGRLFTEADDRPGCDPGVVLSHRFWQREFGGAPSIIGTPITISQIPMTVIGVAPRDFYGVEVGRQFDLALPICAEDRLSPGEANPRLRDATWWLGVFGRRPPGITLEAARRDLAALSPALFRDAPRVDRVAPDGTLTKGVTFTVGAEKGASGYSLLRQQYDVSLWLLLGVAGTVLLIACANLAHLMLARLESRTHELSLRLALGASRGRIVRQLMTEHVLLVATGAALAAWIAPMVGRFVVSLISDGVNPLFVDMRTDWRILAFTAALAGGACLLFGLAPTLRASRAQLIDVLKTAGRVSGGRGQARLRRTFAVTQLALSLVLLVAALLFARSLVNLLSVDTGFQYSNLLEADLDLRRLKLSDAELGAMRQNTLARIEALPGVESASLAGTIPFVNNWYTRIVLNDGTTATNRMMQASRIGPNYFQTMRTPLVRGRDFGPGDTPTTPRVAIVNEAFAREFLPAADPFTATIRAQDSQGLPAGPEVRIVGIVRNTKYQNLRDTFRPLVFYNDNQNPRPSGNAQILIRPRTSIASIQPQVRELLTTGIGGAPFHFHDFEEQSRSSLRQDRLLALICGMFALVGAVLATVGVYGVMAYSVTERVTEIGVRIALGASQRNILTLVLGEAAVILVTGLAVGAAMSVAAGRLAAQQLFQLEWRDPLTLAAAVTLLGLTAGIASYLPARRATRMDPMISLRRD